MPYNHSGEIGDIWKHLSLCAVLSTELPTRYHESNSSYAEWQIPFTARTEYGVFHLLKNGKVVGLRDSLYFKILEKLDTNATNHYLGSPGLSMTCLQSICDNYFFHDLENESLEDIVNFSKNINLLGKISTFCGDSISAFLSTEYCLSKDDFVFLDPYSPFDNNINGYNFFDVFVKAAKNHAKTVFWYGYDSLDNKSKTLAMFQNLKKDLSEAYIQTFDVWLTCMKQDSCSINPGVPGCGIAIANLSSKSVAQIIDYQKVIAHIYEDAIYCGESASLSISHDDG